MADFGFGEDMSSMLDIFPDLGGGGGPVTSELDYGEDQNDDSNSGNFHLEQECKYDPSAGVKVEVEETVTKKEDADQEDDYFLNDGDGAPSQSRRGSRRGRRARPTVEVLATDGNVSSPSSKMGKGSSSKSRSKRGGAKRVTKRSMQTSPQRSEERRESSKYRRKKGPDVTLNEVAASRTSRRLRALKNDATTPTVCSDSEAKKAVGKGDTKRRKKVSEMAPEELEAVRAKWREERRRLRAGATARAGSDNDDKSNSGEDVRSRRSLSRKSDPDLDVSGRKASSGSKRKPVSQMTEQEREAIKVKWREEARLKRQRQREKMTEEERREYLAKESERKRLQRGSKPRIKKESGPKEKRVKSMKVKGERTPKKVLTEEEKQDRNDRAKFRRMEKEMMMTDEEKVERRQRQTLRRLEKLASMTTEELEERKRKVSARARQYRMGWTEEDRANRRARLKKYRDSMNGERRARFLKKLREAHQRKLERLRQDPEKYAQLKKEKSEYAKKRFRELTELKKRMINGEVAREQLASVELKLNKHKGKTSLYANETVEERIERIKERRRLRTVKKSIQKRLKIQEMMESGMSLEQARLQLLTPAQREGRLRRGRINRAKARVRKRLEASGVNPETIQEQLESVEVTCEPIREGKPYKPRPDRFKPVDEAELALLGALEKKPDADVSVATTLAQYTIISLDIHSSPHQYVLTNMTPSKLSHCEESNRSISIGTATPEPIFCVNLNQPHYPSSQIQNIPYQMQPNQVHTLSFPLQVQNLLNPQLQATPIGEPGPAKNSEDHSETSPSHSPPPSSPTSPNQQQNNYIEKNQESNKYNIIEDGKKRIPRPRVHLLREYTNLPDYYKTGVPRGPKKKLLNSVKRDAICDDCGNAYTKAYLHSHKRQMHNPNFKQGRCQLCGMEFRKAYDWYNHYRFEHLGQERKPKGFKKEKELLTKSKGDKRLNKNSEFDPAKRPYMCPQCGAAFAVKCSLLTHEYHMHGEGSKEENFYQCPLCSVKMKRRSQVKNHFKNVHGMKSAITTDFLRDSGNDFGWMLSNSTCERCKVECATVVELKEHIRLNHEDSFFPCKYSGCNVVKLSEVAWRLHMNRCPKVEQHRELLLELRKQWRDNGTDSADRLHVPCEFCGKKIVMMCLKRHYRVVHKLPQEDEWKCLDKECYKKFNAREFLVAHVESIHRIPLEECLAICSKYNKADREGIEIWNPEGKLFMPKKKKVGKGKKPIRKKGKNSKVVKDFSSDSHSSEEESSIKMEEESKFNPRSNNGNGDEEELEVEKILDKRLAGETVQYFLKWKGYGDEYNSWEPESNLGCPKLVAKFVKQWKKKPENKAVTGTGCCASSGSRKSARMAKQRFKLFQKEDSDIDSVNDHDHESDTDVHQIDTKVETMMEGIQNGGHSSNKNRRIK